MTYQATTDRLRRVLTLVEGMRYRQKRGLNTGRNATSTDQTLRMRSREVASLWRELLADETTPDGLLDKLAPRVYREERRSVGLPD